jgi:hypothetical protein
MALTVVTLERRDDPNKADLLLRKPHADARISIDSPKTVKNWRTGR